MTTAADFDTPWKSALARYLPSCLELFLPEAHTDIDWDRGYEVLDKELQQVFPNTDAGRQLVDALVKVWRRDGTERWVLIHIEVQGRYDRQFPKRMFDYWVRIRAAFGHQVVSLAILTDISRRRWPGRYHESAWNTAAALRYEVVKLIDYQSRQAELEASANPFAVIVLAHLTSHQTRGRTAARAAAKFALVRRLYARGLNREDVIELFRFIDWLIDLPAALERELWLTIEEEQEQRGMPYLSSIERMARDEGREEGREEGRQQGIVQGRREGLLAGMEGLLEFRFGAEGQAITEELRQISDLTILEQVNARLRAGATAAEIRSLYQPFHA